MDKYTCVVCGWVHDETIGDPDHGIAPGTPWAEVPESWNCPDCGTPKRRFRNVQGLSPSSRD